MRNVFLNPTLQGKDKNGTFIIQLIDFGNRYPIYTLVIISQDVCSIIYSE